jgi:predicted GIY-YIG superfamily endonuclease
MTKILKIKLDKNPSVVIHRTAVRADKLVYIARANKKMRYPWGNSRIVYIGTTKNGIRRIASSAAWKGEQLLAEHGITQLDFYIVTCTRRKALPGWKRLERALISRFCELFGDSPQANKTGRVPQPGSWKNRFSQKKLDQVIHKLS